MNSESTPNTFKTTPHKDPKTDNMKKVKTDNHNKNPKPKDKMRSSKGAKPLKPSNKVTDQFDEFDDNYQKENINRDIVDELRKEYKGPDFEIDDNHEFDDEENEKEHGDSNNDSEGDISLNIAPGTPPRIRDHNRGKQIVRREGQNKTVPLGNPENRVSETERDPIAYDNADNIDEPQTEQRLIRNNNLERGGRFTRNNQENSKDTLRKENTIYLEKNGTNDDEHNDWSHIINSRFENSISVKSNKKVNKTPKKRRPQDIEELLDKSGFNQSSISHHSENEIPLSDNQSFFEKQRHAREKTMNLQDSALGIKAFEDQELSQIMNPGLNRILDHQSLHRKHKGTIKSLSFLKDNFIKLERLVHKIREKDKRYVLELLDNFNEESRMVLEIRRKLQKKKNKKEGLRKLSSIALVYQKQLAVKFITSWYDIMQNARQEEKLKMRFAEIFTVMMNYRAKELKRASLLKLQKVGSEIRYKEELKKQTERENLMNQNIQKQLLLIV